MPFIILKEPGFEKFTGLFGTVMFSEGRSVEPVSNMEAARFGAITRCETEDGTNPSPAQTVLDRRGDKAKVEQDTTKVTEQELLAEASLVATAKSPLGYTREELEKIADKQGIGGLRVIANEVGVKARSVPEMIDRLMEKQGV